MLFVHSVVFEGEKFNHASQLIFLVRKNKLKDKSLKFNHLWTPLFGVKSRFVSWLINLDFQINYSFFAIWYLALPRLQFQSIGREKCIIHASNTPQEEINLHEIVGNGAWAVPLSQPGRPESNPLKSSRWCASYAGDRRQFTDRDQTWPSSVRALMSVRPCRADRSGPRPPYERTDTIN